MPSSFQQWRSVTFAAILLCFLLPFASVSCPGAKVSLTGLDLARGKTVEVPQGLGQAENRVIAAQPLAQAAAACAALGLLLSLVTGSASRVPSIVTGGAGAILLLLLKQKIEGQADLQVMGMASVKIETAFWLALLGFAGVAAISLLRKPAPAAPPQSSA